MKKLEIDEMTAVAGGYKETVCNVGMSAAGYFLGLSVAAATGGVGALAFTIGWGAFSGWVCDQAG